MSAPDRLPARDDAPSVDVEMVAESVAVPVIVIASDGGVLACNTAARHQLRRVPLHLADLDRRLHVPGFTEVVERVRRSGESLTMQPPRADNVATPWPRASITLRRLPLSGRRGDAVTVTIAPNAVAAGAAELEAANATMAASLATASAQLQAVTEELRGQASQLERVQRADEQKNTFLAMLAHELRGPLAPITSALHIIRRRVATTAGIAPALDIAERQVRHQARLLDDLLDISRIVHGKVALRRDPVDLAAVTRAAADALAVVVQKRAHQLEVDVPSDPVVVVGDATRLEQIARNLLSNAVKYTPAGGRIDLRVERRGQEAVLTVRDNGAGITAEMLPHVFELFAQADSSLARSEGGLGIGLTLVARLAELHGGTASAESAGPGHGSTFTVRLPLATREDVPARAPRAPARGGQRRVLVVEDNRDARALLRVVLEMDGHVVEEAPDGTAAVRTAVEWAPDVVLLDIGLPGLDGYEVARRIRKRLGSVVRLIALTGYGDEEARQRSAQAGFDGHLVKPVDLEELGRVLAST